MKLKRIHVNRQAVAQNLKHGTGYPVLTVKSGRDNVYGDRVQIDGPCELVNAEACGKKPLSCGARVYIETKAPVRVTYRDDITVLP